VHAERQLTFFLVVTYTAVGGLKATFLTDFLHTTIALILLIYFSLAVLTNEHIGGISGLYEKVKATDDYIPGNYKGSLLTMKSKSCKLTTPISSMLDPCKNH
jgi:Na+/proline symporter